MSQSCQDISQNQLATKPRIDITFQDVLYRVETSDEAGEKFSKTILHGVSGLFKAGELSVIMGASGAGKTTLLNILAGRVNPSEGEVCANGNPYDFHSFGGFGNYVMQGDILMETLTVRETLEFAASLKIRNDLLARKRVDEIMRKMKLQNCANVFVGGFIVKGVSGGQKKRTALAVELLSDPQVVALDEPTSGLDSLTSFIIINELKTLALSGKTIFLTIHQPGTQICELFDKLLLMAEGRIVYQGPSATALDYFANNFGLICPQLQNPAEFFMSILHPEDLRNTARYEEYFQTYEKHSRVEISNRIKAVQTSLIVPRVSETDFAHNVGTLLKRDLRNISRNPIVMQSRIFQVNFIALFTAGLYFNAGRQDYTNQIHWQAIAGYMFFISMDVTMQAVTPVAITFPLEHLLFLKEQNSKMYTLNEYFISRNLIEVPYMLIIPIFFILISYWMIGLAGTAEQFFTMYFILVLMSFTGTSAGIFIGSMTTNPKSVGNALQAVLVPLLIFGGYYKNLGNIASWVIWIKFISPFTYIFTALVDNQTKYKPSRVGDLNFDVSMWVAILLIFLIGVGFRIGAYILLSCRRGKLQ